MSCNSAIYTVNNTKQTIGSAGQIPFGSIVRRFGKNVQKLDGGSIVLCGSGYYDVEIQANLAPTVAGDISIQLYQDGVPVPGAVVIGTVANANDYVSLGISCLVRNCAQNCNSSVLTLVTDAEAVVENLATVVKKV